MQSYYTLIALDLARSGPRRPTGGDCLPSTEWDSGPDRSIRRTAAAAIAVGRLQPSVGADRPPAR